MEETTLSSLWERLLEKKSSLQVARDADDLLPSISLLAEFTRDGGKADLRDRNDKMMAGVSISVPLWDQQERAAHRISQVNDRRTRLNVRNTHHRLQADLRNPDLRIQREKELRAIAEEKIRLARSVLGDESENYTYGKASLNDYISAVNLLDANRFNKIQHGILWRKLHIEWLRLTDQLVTAEQARRRHQDVYSGKESR